MTKFKDVLHHVHAEADLLTFKDEIEELIERRNALAGPAILPPREIKTKGRPRKKRLAAAHEAQPSGKRVRLSKVDEDGDGHGRRNAVHVGNVVIILPLVLDEQRWPIYTKI
ncbi:hypothetical protein B0H19DRAFT_1071059 [Mycena capillaripes]|nr:hypothetical protein B0H19DRAFT_1071059 [Mycena capillaripes]